MFEENKTYTYEEIKEIIKKACTLASKSLMDDFEKADTNNKLEGMDKLMLSLQFTLAYAELNQTLFKTNK